MKRLAVLATILLAACTKDPAGLKGLDPTVLFNNVSPGAPNVGGTVTMVWYDQSGQVSKTDIPFGESRCVKFIATTLADSVRFVIYAGDTLSTTAPWMKQASIWFNPQTGAPTTDVAKNYPNGAEYWVFDWSKTPYVWNPDKAPC